MALNRSPVLVHQSYSVEGNDLNHLVEGNQAGLFCSIVFERITIPCPLPPPHTNISYIPNIKAVTGSRLCGFREDFFLSSLYNPI